MSEQGPYSSKARQQRAVALTHLVESSGKLDNLECPQCGQSTLAVWFTRPERDEYRTWFVCDQCDFSMHMINQGRPRHYAEARIHARLNDCDEQIAIRRRFPNPLHRPNEQLVQDRSRMVALNRALRLAKWFCLAATAALVLKASFYAFSRQPFKSTDPASGYDAFLPYKHALIAITITVAVFVIERLVRARYDGSSSGHCSCGYDLTGNTSGICPECGTPTPAATVPNP